MPKFLIQASYTAEGLKGLQKDKASGRKAAMSAAAEAAGGRLDALYYCLGKDDVVAILDLPDAIAAAALAVTASSSGLVHSRTTTLLTVEEADKALSKSIPFRAPGR